MSSELHYLATDRQYHWIHHFTLKSDKPFPDSRGLFPHETSASIEDKSISYRFKNQVILKQMQTGCEN